MGLNGFYPLLVLLVSIVKAVLILAFVMINALILLWLERKISGRIQNRIGPYRVGRPHGWAQAFADVIKLLSKEDIIPTAADRWVFVLAAVVVFAAALAVYVVVPFGPGLYAQNLNIGMLYVAAMTSFTVLAIFMAGWGSNNKYAILGALRVAAQLIAYEVPLVLSVIGVIMLAKSLSLVDIVNAQKGIWFIILQPLGFIIYLIASIAELNRTPFDLAEAESELVAGYAVEYSGLRWAFFFVAEYANLISMGAIASVLFLGGWKGPWLPPYIWMIIKIYVFVFIAMWLRWTLPRIRIDHLMSLGWKFMIPAALLNIAWTGLYLLIW